LLLKEDLSDLQLIEFKYIGAVLPENLKYEGKEGSFSNKLTPLELLHLFRAGLERIVNHNKKPIAFKMSGGLDSRIMIYLLKDIGFLDFDIHIVCHPLLSEDKDADVVLAKRALAYLGYKNKVVIKKCTSRAYLEPFTDEFIQLSGIYGTEVLGGQMFDELPIVKRVKQMGIDNYISRLEPSSREYIRCIYDKYILPGDTSFFVSLFTKSPLSTIYDSNGVHGGWSKPNRFKSFCLTPFAGEDFLHAMTCYTKHELERYNLYHQLYQLLPVGYREIPLCSDYTSFQSCSVQAPQHLINAKSL
jgi:hypothetical protein